MAPLIHPSHIGLRSLGHHDDWPDYPDVDFDPIARFILVFCISFLIITSLVVVLKLLGVCLLACLIGCRTGPEERIVYRVSLGRDWSDGGERAAASPPSQLVEERSELTKQVYRPIYHDQQPPPHPVPNLAHGVQPESSDAPPPYSPQASGHKNYGATQS